MSLSIRVALQAARQRVEAASSSASLDAQLLLGFTLGVERSYVLAHPEQVLTHEQEALYQALVERCTNGEPLAYILARRAFYDRDFEVSPAVLIPRPETEILLQVALDFVRQRLPAHVDAVDVGTGSGALAVTLAAHYPQAQMYAVDISPTALEIAQLNAEKYEVGVRFFEGDLLTPLMEADLKVDLIMANLPYIATDELAHLTVSRYEPRLALDGGSDGLDLVRRLLAQASAVCKPDALMLLEIGAEQGERARQLAQTAVPNAEVTILKDYAGLDRIVAIRAP